MGLATTTIILLAHLSGSVLQQRLNERVTHINFE